MHAIITWWRSAHLAYCRRGQRSPRSHGISPAAVDNRVSRRMTPCAPASSHANRRRCTRSETATRFLYIHDLKPQASPPRIPIGSLQLVNVRSALPLRERGTVFLPIYGSTPHSEKKLNTFIFGKFYRIPDWTFIMLYTSCDRAGWPLL